jgi:hypothetical protein
MILFNRWGICLHIFEETTTRPGAFYRERKRKVLAIGRGVYAWRRIPLTPYKYGKWNYESVATPPGACG